MPEVNLVLALTAGVLGFLSPCIVPLIPGYLSFVSGLSLSELSPTDRRQRRARVLLSTAIFVVGFATIFTALGASATVLGNFVLMNRMWLGRVGGAIVIILGLSVWGMGRIPALTRERRFQGSRRGGLLGLLPGGMGFGVAWKACLGPVQAGRLPPAATSRRAA